MKKKIKKLIIDTWPIILFIGSLAYAKPYDTLLFVCVICIIILSFAIMENLPKITKKGTILIYKYPKLWTTIIYMPLIMAPIELATKIYKNEIVLIATPAFSMNLAFFFTNQIFKELMKENKVPEIIKFMGMLIYLPTLPMYIIRCALTGEIPFEELKNNE